MSGKKVSTMEDILRQRRVNIADFGLFDDTAIREILILINPAEISRLCVTSQRFNRICTDVSFWKMKVKRDYGIEKKYGFTWKETCINLFKVNMINLNKEWINGSTYAEIVKDALEQKDSVKYLERLQYKHHPEHLPWTPVYNGKIFILNGEMQDQIVNQLQRDLTDEEIETLKNTFTLESAVIYRAFFEIKESCVLPLSRQAYLDDTIQFDGDLAQILQPFIDVYPYIMLFSSLPNHELNNILDYGF
uniref:F-box domain-containing protein n=1 Tax=Pithovirus LCPAC403 TaxID=2506596 RepID=A0A481ZAR3_9VIRU|nr:MAG: uncharacterized protein LCPAC403_01470 [Pithovirus LCPAC403]